MLITENLLRSMIQHTLTRKILKESNNQTGVLNVDDAWWNDYADNICKGDEKYDYKIISGLFMYLNKEVHMTAASHGIINLMMNTLQKKSPLEGFGPNSNRLLGIIKFMNESTAENLKIPAVLHILFCNLKPFVKLVVKTPDFYNADREFSTSSLKTLASGCKALGTKIAYYREDKNIYHDFYNKLTSFEGEEFGNDAKRRKSERMQDMKDANNSKSKTEKYSVTITNPEDRGPSAGLKKYQAAVDKENDNDIEGADAIWLSFTDEEIEQLADTGGEARLKSSIEKAKSRKRKKEQERIDYSRSGRIADFKGGIGFY